MRVVVAFFLLVAAAVPALATQDGWPALYDVQGVAEDDVLNIRAEPSAGASIVGQLAHDAEAVEVIRPNPRQTWGLVNHGEGTGWVSLSYLQRRPGQWFGARPDPARCFGTEPFWALEFDASNEVEWSLAGTPPREGSVTAEFSSTSRRDAHGFRIGLPMGEGGETREGVGIVMQQACSDGMSSREYGLRLELMLEAQEGPALYSGCCTLAR